MSTEFKREQRYFVVKVKDAKEYLDARQLEKLAEIADTISEGRKKGGIPDVECVVVESDWPEYEPTWKAIEARVTGVQPAPSVPDFSNTKDAARYRWLRENGLANEKRESRAVLPRGGKKASMAFRYWTAPEELDMTIDAMIAAAPEPKP